MNWGQLSNHTWNPLCWISFIWIRYFPETLTDCRLGMQAQLIILATCTVVLIKFLPYSGATAQTRSAALWGVSGSYGQAPAQQGMSGLVRETSHLWLYSSPSPSLQPILREPATSILIALYTFECIIWVATESLWRYVQGNKWILKLHIYIYIYISVI